MLLSFISILIENATRYRGYITPGLWNYWHYNITYHEIPDGSYLVFSTAATKEGANPPGMIPILCVSPNYNQSDCLKVIT